jgi:cobalt-zinc-cadmium efflux system outer membrane protein
MRFLSLSQLLLWLTVAGCAAKPVDDRFTSLQDLSLDRTGAAVRWNRSSSDSKAIDEQVKRLVSAELTADSAVQIALLNNPSLQATYEDLGIAAADVLQAGLIKNPVLDVSLRFPDRSPKLTNLEFSLAEDFLDALLISARSRLALAQLEATRFRVGSAILRLATDTRAAYYAAVAARQTLTLQRRAVAAVEASAEAAQKLFDAGNISSLELLSYQLQLAQERMTLMQDQSELVDAQEILSAFMGVDEPNGFMVAQSLATPSSAMPPLAELEDAAVNQRLDLAARRQQIEIAARRGGLVKATRYVSDLQLGVDAERDPDGQWVIGPTFSIPLPLFDQGQARAEKALADVRQAEHEYAAMKKQARSEVRRSYRRMAAAQMRLQTLQQAVLPLRERLLEQSQLFYNGMFVGVFELLQARRNELDAQRAYIAAASDYWIERTRLEGAVGRRLAIAPAATAPSTGPAAPEHHHHGD